MALIYKLWHVRVCKLMSTPSLELCCRLHHSSDVASISRCSCFLRSDSSQAHSQVLRVLLQLSNLGCCINWRQVVHNVSVASHGCQIYRPHTILQQSQHSSADYTHYAQQLLVALYMHVVEFPCLLDKCAVFAAVGPCIRQPLHTSYRQWSIMAQQQGTCQQLSSDKKQHITAWNEGWALVMLHIGCHTPVHIQN